MKLAKQRGPSPDEWIVSQLLAELDSLHQSPHIKVFVMAATNRADLLDPALLTPGRFDKVIHVEPGTDVESKTKILRAVSKKVLFAEDVNLEEVVSFTNNDAIHSLTIIGTSDTYMSRFSINGDCCVMGVYLRIELNSVMPIRESY
uniref:ATPase_AAA_core domain-containing protein n=1 Tax=Angiostrongylus cantonensis TaxID=6313 RepID=A0A0K0DND1_ANGCA